MECDLKHTVDTCYYHTSGIQKMQRYSQIIDIYQMFLNSTYRTKAIEKDCNGVLLQTF